MQRWISFQLIKTFLWDRIYCFSAKVRHLNLNVWLVKRGFESSFSSFHSVLAGGEGDITWMKDDIDISDDKNVTKVDETSSKLVIENAMLEDSGIYTCHCDFDSGHVDQITTRLHIYGMLSTNTELCCITCCITTWKSVLSFFSFVRRTLVWPD